MKKITSLAELKESIILLKIKQADEKALLTQQFMITRESMRPANLIKHKIHDLVTSPNLKENLLNAALSLATGFVSKKVIVGSTYNPLKKLFGTLLQIGVTGIVAKNADGIKSTAMNLIGNIFRKENTPHRLN